MLILRFRKVMIVKVIIKKRIIFASRERIDCISSEKHIVKKRYILDRLKIDFISKFIFIHNFFDN